MASVFSVHRIIISIIWRTKFIWEAIFLKRNPFIKHKSIILIRMDAIGDYILFRNFIKEIKDSEKYKKYKITLCGNLVWKDISLKLDAGEIDNFIWIDRNKFNKENIQYYFNKIVSIYLKGFEILIHPTYSRDLISETIVKYSGAKNKIGNSGDCTNLTFENKLIFDKYYDELIPSSNKFMFEFDRNKLFFEEVLNKKINFPKPFINTEKINNIKKNPYIVFSISSGMKFRTWDILNFEQLAIKIITNTIFNIYITGFCEKDSILQNTDNNRIINDINKIKLNELISLIGNSVLLIGHDSAPIHIAAALDVPFVCISNGNHFKRFVPYPELVSNKCSFIFPNDNFYKKEEENNLAELYKNNSDLDINLISVDEVYNSVLHFLQVK